MLNDVTCRNAQPQKKVYRKFDAHGLYLEVTPKGSKYWRLKYRFLGKERRLALGVYPEVSLAEAREKQAVARKQLSLGLDPTIVKQEKKRDAVLNAANSFEAVAREWHERHKMRVSEKHANTIITRLEADVFPVIGKRPIRDLTPPEILDVLRKIEKRGAHELAHRAKQYIGQVLRYGIATGRTERDHTADLRDALLQVKTTHYAALEPNELPEFLKVLRRNDARLYPQTRMAMEFLMLTFVRTSEMIEARWEEFDLAHKTWLIPAERMKMRAPHLVPLSRQTLEILEELKPISGHREWVFPSHVKPRQHMSNNTILEALRRMGYRGRMTGHGFRALAMTTIKERLGYRHEVIDRQLAHSHRNSVDAAYDRAKFLDDRRTMMQDWADYLDRAALEEKVIVGKFGK